MELTGRLSLRADRHKAVSKTFGTGEDMTASDGAGAAELERLRVELWEAKAEIARLQEENERLRPARPDAARVTAHRSQRAPTLFPPPAEVPIGVDALRGLSDFVSGGDLRVHAVFWLLNRRRRPAAV